MPTTEHWTRVQKSPKRHLVLYWISWKLILAGIALASPGVGYDTSTDVLFASNHGSSSRLQAFVRWDAIYFSQTARRGYRFEQEWAFGWGFTRVLRWGARVLPFVDHGDSGLVEAFFGILVAHVSHLLSVFVLYDMSRRICYRRSDDRCAKFAFLAALLHIISPAGIFLSAPYAESPFALLNFLGYHFYLKAYELRGSDRSMKRDLSILAAGLLFGFASTFRSNGLLSGLIFAYDAVMIAWGMLEYGIKSDVLKDLFVVVSAGSLVALGSLIPQSLAFCEYCLAAEESRPWCNHWLPSIYAWVQSHYWGVGFLRYWTLSNLPLFLLAGPMLCILLVSSVWAWSGSATNMEGSSNPAENGPTVQAKEIRNPRCLGPSVFHHPGFIRRLLIPQFVLAILALTTYHVQVITRLASGYPVWYWWLAWMILEDRKVQLLGMNWSSGKIIVHWTVCYALIQGGLFASFLPPA